MRYTFSFHFVNEILLKNLSLLHHEKYFSIIWIISKDDLQISHTHAHPNFCSNTYMYTHINTLFRSHYLTIHSRLFNLLPNAFVCSFGIFCSCFIFAFFSSFYCGNFVHNSFCNFNFRFRVMAYLENRRRRCRCCVIFSAVVAIRISRTHTYISLYFSAQYHAGQWGNCRSELTGE